MVQCLILVFIVYKILRSSLLFFVRKIGQTHEVAITIISAFPRTCLPVAGALTNVTNDYTCIQRWEQSEPDGTGVNSHRHHVVIGVKFPFCSPTEGTCLLRPLWIVSILTLDPFEPKTLKGRFLTFHGVIEANLLMLYAIIFTAAFSSCAVPHLPSTLQSMQE